MFNAMCKFLGVSSGEGQRGKFYEISFLIDGDTYKIRCDDNVFAEGAKLHLGDDVELRLELRNYRGDWFPRIKGLTVI